jgi:hypothetical protein
MIRRLKIDLPEPAIPLPEEIDIFLPISPAQRAIYKVLPQSLDTDVLQDMLDADDNTSASDRQDVMLMTRGKDKIVDSKV